MDAVEATDASVNIGAPPDLVSQGRWVSQVQAKLHCWAAADPGRRWRGDSAWSQQTCLGFGAVLLCGVADNGGEPCSHAD